ncbi:MAG: radical SAM protein [Firmicutes bacterium]|nr:radical SAM protein [Bacillota bacterium]
MTIDHCTLCPRACGAQRTETAGSGFCGMGILPVVARAAPHFGEEPCVTGTRGSGAVFFRGCGLGCVFCQNSEISRGDGPGRRVTAEALGGVFAALREQGVHNINLVTASHVAPVVAQALRRYPPGIPVVYNCGGYESLETLRLLDGLVDVYLPDFKYADADTALRCANAPDYPQAALAAIRAMRAQTGPAQYDEQGLLTRGILVRHLVLPGLSGASMAALSLLRDALPADVPVSLMRQYTPCGQAAGIKGLDRPLLGREYRRVAAHMRALGFEGYAQGREAAGTEMIPAWEG